MPNHGFWRWPSELYVVANPETFRIKYRLYSHPKFAQAATASDGALYLMPVLDISQLNRLQ